MIFFASVEVERKGRGSLSDKTDGQGPKSHVHIRFSLLDHRETVVPRGQNAEMQLSDQANLQQESKKQRNLQGRYCNKVNIDTEECYC